MSDLISRQQAIDALKNRWLKTRNYEGIGEDIAEECEIYLRTVPSIQFATDTNVGTKHGTNLAEVGTDLISRQAAIDAIDEISREVDDGYGFDYAKWREYFCELPPEHGTNLASLGTDTISRQDAIDICDHAIDSFKGQFGAGVLVAIRESITELPPTQPKRGRWIKLDMHRGMADHKCTACEQECYVPTCMGEPLYAFCPNCGSYNGGENEI